MHNRAEFDQHIDFILATTQLWPHLTMLVEGGENIVRIRIWLMVAAFALASAISTQTANAGSKNPNSILKGTYAGAGTALQWVTPTGGSAYKQDVAFAGVRNFDGKGNFGGPYTATIAATSSAGSPTICVYSTSGSYSVNPDGTGTVSETDTTMSGGCVSFDSTYNIAVSEGGNTVCSVGTNPSFAVSGAVVNSQVFSFCQTRQ